MSVFWREEKKDVGDAQDDKWIAKTFAARTYGVGRCIRQVVGLYVVVMWALRVSPTRPGIADVQTWSLRHFPGPSSHLFDSDMIKSVVQVQEKNLFSKRTAMSQYAHSSKPDPEFAAFLDRNNPPVTPH